MSQDLLENENTRSNYFRLDGLQRDVVDREYGKCYETCNSQMESLPDKISSEQLIQSFLTPNEELIPIRPLSAESYHVRLATDPYSDRFLDFGYNVKMYLTDKRLILLDSGEWYNPVLKNYEYGGKIERIDVGCKRTSSSNFTAFPLNSIYGISLKLENNISNTSFIKKVSGANKTMIIIGVILALFGLLLSSGPRDAQGIGILMLIVGIIIAIAGFLSKSEDVSGPQPETKKTRLLRLVTLDPIYKNRASLSIKIDTKEHDAKSIVQWARELQNRCEPINNPKAFETIMNV